MIRLEGTEYGAGRVGVVFAHERPRSQDAWAPIALEAAAKGFHALTLNFRGYGVSGGSRSDLGLIDLDVEAAVAYLRSAGASKVVLVGGSMGGTACLVAASRADVDGVVAVSAPAKFMGLDAAAVVSKLEPPALFVAGAQDQPYADDARTMARRTLEGSQLEIVPGAGGHASELLSIERIRTLILDFIDKNGR